MKKNLKKKIILYTSTGKCEEPNRYTDKRKWASPKKGKIKPVICRKISSLTNYQKNTNKTAGKYFELKIKTMIILGVGQDVVKRGVCVCEHSW